MKKSLFTISAAGFAAGLILRLVQLKNSFDAAGMVPKGDGVSTLLYLVCFLAAFGALVVCVRARKGSIPAPEKGEKTPVRGILMVVSAVALLASYLPPAFDGKTGDYIILVLAFIAACAMAVQGLYHVFGHLGSLLGGCILPVYLAALLIKDYRTWSYNPLVEQFAFSLLVLVFAMVASFELAAFRVGKGRQRLMAFLAAGTVILAGPAMADGGVRNILHVAALSLYVAAEAWPYLIAKVPEKLIPDGTEGAEEATVEEISEDVPEETLSVEEEYEKMLEESFKVENKPEADDMTLEEAFAAEESFYSDELAEELPEEAPIEEAPAPDDEVAVFEEIEE